LKPKALKERIKKASGYKDVDFFNAQSIGVIARGPSNVFLSHHCHKFSHCFLAGEFNKYLAVMGGYLLGKDIVLNILQVGRYRTPPDKCRYFKIGNVQTYFPANSRKIMKIRKVIIRDLHVVGYGKEQSELAERVFKDKIYSTGICAVFNAACFYPKEVHILGLDFYNEDMPKYAVFEEHDQGKEGNFQNSIIGMRRGMIEDLRSICDIFSSVEFFLYTTYRRIISRRNLHVEYV